jgi:hypothetical protein
MWHCLIDLQFLGQSQPNVFNSNSGSSIDFWRLMISWSSSWSDICSQNANQNLKIDTVTQFHSNYAPRPTSVTEQHLLDIYLYQMTARYHSFLRSLPKAIYTIENNNLFSISHITAVTKEIRMQMVVKQLTKHR